VKLPRLSSGAWEAAGIWFQALTTIGITVTVGLIGLGQWQRDKTLNLQERWASSEMQARRNRLVDAIVCRAPQETMFRQTTPDVLLRVVVPEEGYIGIEADLPAYLDFFAEVQNCVRSGICRRDLACSQFGREARTLDGWYRPFIQRQRVLFQTQSYGSDFERFIETCGDLLAASEPPGADDEGDRQVLREMNEEIENGRGLLRQQQVAACARMSPANAGDQLGSSPGSRRQQAASDRRGQ